MKVLVVGTGGSIVSGISTAADQMVTTLSAMGHSVERLNSGEQMRRRSNAVNFENVRAVLTDAVAVARRSRRAQADVVWIHTMGVPALPALRALAIAAAARATGRPVIVQFHAFGLERAVADGGQSVRMALRALAAVTTTMVVLHEAGAEAVRAATGSSTVGVLENWVDVPPEFTPLPPQPPLRLMFVGGIVRRKGVPQLVEAMRALADIPVQLRLVGGAGEDGPAALDRLRAGAHDLVATGRVTFAGEKDAEGVRAELRGTHLFVLPSEAEGMPISMLEAMAEARPVLVTDAGNMRSVVEESRCGWVLPDRDPATIAKCIRSIYDDPETLGEAALSARRAAEERYSAGARRAEIEAILNKVTSAQPGALAGR